MAAIYRRHFQMHFLCFYSNFTKLRSQWLKSQQVTVGSGNGLAPNSRQAIILTKDVQGVI